MITRWLFAIGCKQRHAFGQMIVERDGGELHVHLTGLDLGDVEQVIDDVEHMLA
jgi:hypothetical protein